jgi:transposase
MLQQTRHLVIRQQTAVINAIRAHLAEFGFVAPVLAAVLRNCSVSLPIPATRSYRRLLAPVSRLSYHGCQRHGMNFDCMISVWRGSNETSKAAR